MAVNLNRAIAGLGLKVKTIELLSDAIKFKKAFFKIKIKIIMYKTQICKSFNF